MTGRRRSAHAKKEPRCVKGREKTWTVVFLTARGSKRGVAMGGWEGFTCSKGALKKGGEVGGACSVVARGPGGGVWR